MCTAQIKNNHNADVVNACIGVSSLYSKTVSLLIYSKPKAEVDAKPICKIT